MSNADFPKAFITSLVQQAHDLKLSVALGCTSAALSLVALPLLPVEPVARLLVASLGLGVASAVSANAKTYTRTSAYLQDLELANERGLLQFFTQTLTQQPLWTSPETLVPEALDESTVVSDLVGYWRKQQKHLLVVGGTGDGKSVFVQALASQLQGWHFRLLDTDASAEDWLQLRALDCTRLLTTNEAIADELTSQLQELEQRLEEGKRLGWSVYKRQAQPVLSVVEEYLTLAMNVEVAPDYLKRLAVRGRKAQQFIAIVSQNDTQDALGLSGQASLVNDCFVRVYLGKKAIARAKLLKRPELVQWLQEQGFNGCLVDDQPALRPQAQTREKTRAEEPQTLTTTTSQARENQEPTLADVLEPSAYALLTTLASALELEPLALVASVRKLKLQGLVTLDVCRSLGCSGGERYAQAKVLVEALEARGLLT